MVSREFRKIALPFDEDAILEGGEPFADYFKRFLVQVKKELEALERVLNAFNLSEGSTKIESTTIEVTTIETTTIEVAGLTAARLMQSDASSTVISVADLTSWIAETSNQVLVADDGDGTVTLSLPQDIDTNAVLEVDGVQTKVTAINSGYTLTKNDTFVLATASSEGTFYPATGTDDGSYFDIAFDNYSQSAYIGYRYSGHPHYMFTRFPNTIPAGATITEAKIIIKNGTGTSGGAGAVNVRIYFNDIDIAVAPISVAEYNALDKTIDYTEWNNVPLFTPEYSTFDSPDIATTLQELIDRPGRHDDDPVMVMIENGTDGVQHRGAVRTYEYGAYWGDSTLCTGLYAKWEAGKILIPTSLLSFPGKPYYIFKVDSSGTAVSFYTEGAETINGVATEIGAPLSLSNQYDGVKLVTDGTNWIAEYFYASGISDGNMLLVDGSPSDDEYAKFTASGLEGRTYAEVRTDINVEDGSTADQTKEDIDGLGLSHDSLADVSADDHHAQSHTLASHSTKAHSELTGVTSDLHHAKSHAHDGADGSGTVAHSDTTGQGTDDHHAQSHTIVSHSDTTATGAELDDLTDNTICDTLHRHSELVASDGSPDPALSVNATGQVGIGTTAPTSVFGKTLHISDSNSASISLQDTGVSAPNKWDIGTDAGNLYFYVHGLDHRMTILKGGNVGINTTSPDTKLQVVGDCKFGDDNTNYATFATDGELTLIGTARVEKILWIGANGIKAPGAKPATFVEDGLTGCWEFADAILANQESVSGTVKIPDDMDRSVVPKFGIGWHANGISPGDCEWQFEYLWIAPNEDVTAAAQETLTVTSTASATSEGLVVAEVTGIDLPSSTDVAMLWRITRLSADANDTIVAVTHMRGNYFKYTANKLGEAT